MTELDTKEGLCQTIEDQRRQIFKGSPDDNIRTIFNPDIRMPTDLPALADLCPQFSGCRVSEISVMLHTPPMDGSSLTVRLELVSPQVQIMSFFKKAGGAEIRLNASDTLLEQKGNAPDLDLTYLQILHEELTAISRLSS